MGNQQGNYQNDFKGQVSNYSQNNQFQTDARNYLNDLSKACQQALGIQDSYSNQKTSYNQQHGYNQPSNNYHAAGSSQGSTRGGRNQSNSQREFGGYQDRNKGVQGAGW